MDSYYKCLAKRFAQSSNDGKCSQNNTCYPFTLPNVNREVPICKNNKERSCFEEAVLKLEEDQQKYCKRSCTVKEFQTEVGTERIMIIGENVTNWESFPMGFQYQLASPAGTKDQRSKEFFKTVKQEYLVNSLLSLVGNVGGTMGMFIGFSIIGMFESMTAYLDILWKRLILRM